MQQKDETRTYEVYKVLQRSSNLEKANRYLHVAPTLASDLASRSSRIAINSSSGMPKGIATGVSVERYAFPCGWTANGCCGRGCDEVLSIRASYDPLRTEA